MIKKVFVSGCFDVLHSGHIAFLQEAATYGNLYVALGSDSTVQALKKRKPLYTENERKYMLEALSCVHKVYISPGSGMLDFVDVLDEVCPDIFFVNEDGDGENKPFIRTEEEISNEIKQTLQDELAVAAKCSA